MMDLIHIYFTGNHIYIYIYEWLWRQSTGICHYPIYFEKGFGLFEPFNSVSKITAVARLVLTDFDLVDRDMYIYER